MNTRIRRDNDRDMLAIARLYEREDSDTGFLARQILRLLAAERQEREEVSALHDLSDAPRTATP